MAQSEQSNEQSHCRLADLADLAELMAESSWQSVELARIKTKFGYRLCHRIYDTLDKLFCGNLFSYIDDRKFQHAPSERSSKQGYRPLSRGRVLALQNSTDSQTIGSSLLLDSRATRQLALEQMNARIYGRERKFGKMILFSRLLLLYCCCCCLGLLMSTIYQYKHDYYVYHLRRFQLARPDGKASPAGSIYELANVSEQQLLARLAEAKTEAKLFGSFLLNRAYFAQSCYILMTLLCILTYPGPLLHFRLKGHFDFHYLRMLLHWDQEQRNCNRMVVDLIEKLCLSSERFLQVSLVEHQARAFGFSFKREKNSMVKRLYSGQIELFEWKRRNRSEPSALLPVSRAATSKKLGQDQRASMEAKQAYADEHKWLVRTLRLLALTGRLQPLDRCDVQEMSRITSFYAVFVLLVAQSCFTWNIILFSALPLYFGFVYELDFMDIVSFVELGSLNVLLTVGGTFYLSMAQIYCREQARIAQKLRAMICSFIENHRRILDASSGKTNSRNASLQQRRSRSCLPEDYYDALNSDLLLILMHYKIFAHQSRPAQRPLGFVLLCCIGLMTIFPVIVRLHLPYLLDMESKVLSIIVCFIMIGLPDLSMVPVCWMHSRCLDLSRDLWKLMAVIVDIADHPKLGPFLNEHSVWLLRKELSHPEQQYGRFAIVAFGIKFTYAELLKLHFWLGFVILSFIIELRSAGPDSSAHNSAHQAASTSDSIMFSSWFADPLGISSPFSL